MSRCAGNHLPATRILSGPKSLKSLGPKLATISQAVSLWNNLSTNPASHPAIFISLNSLIQTRLTEIEAHSDAKRAVRM
jgi:hypothetical protein